MTSTESSTSTTVTSAVRDGTYGERVVAVEPGGAEFIALAERHGSPLSLFWTWMSPNLEFATVFVGVISVAFFEQTLPMAITAIVLGTGLGAVSHGVLSSRGPRHGVPQMILSRVAFGFRGNVLPAGLNAVVAGIGWFAVNSVSGTFALNSLTGLPKVPSRVLIVLVQIVVAFLGHNFVHGFERIAFPLLAVAFVIAAIVILPKASLAGAPGGGGIGGFLITVGAAFGYAAGWNPYAADYTRYLSPNTSRRAVGMYAGLGVFVSCTVLEIVGAASATILAPADASPTDAFTGHMPSLVAKLVLLAIVVGAISANAINIYSGTMSFLALGVRLPLAARRAMVALVFGVLGFVVALMGLHDAGHAYENFLLVISYWIGPWLGVYFCDWVLRRGTTVDGFLFDPRHNPWSGFAAMAVAMVVSIGLFSNQAQYLAPLPKAVPGLGDITFEVGLALAAALYAVFFRMQHPAREGDVTARQTAGT